MFIDKELELSSAQAVTASAASTNIIDLGAAGEEGFSGKHIVITVTEAATAAGAATVVFSLEKDDNSSFSSAVAVHASAAIGKAALVVGYELIIPIPFGLDEQYMRMYYTVATGPLTAGKFTAQVVEGVQKNKSYPDAV